MLQPNKNHSISVGQVGLETIAAQGTQGAALSFKRVSDNEYPERDYRRAPREYPERDYRRAFNVYPDCD